LPNLSHQLPVAAGVELEVGVVVDLDASVVLDVGGTTLVVDAVVRIVVVMGGVDVAQEVRTSNDTKSKMSSIPMAPFFILSSFIFRMNLGLFDYHHEFGKNT
jgi:hypothetical protein